jgi:hypothetical protein
MSKASEWREKSREAAREDAEPLTLPSGMTILARRPNPLQLAAWGKLPYALATAAAGDGGAAVAAVPDEEKVKEVVGFYRDVLVYCCVDPRVSLNPQGPDEIHPREISEKDWTFIISWAARAEEARALTAFRDDGRDAGDRRDSETIRGAPVDSAGDARLHAVSGVRSGRRRENPAADGGGEG